ncbi:MAG: GntR family transcriptional regulator [Capsulimonadaceae bacterium]|nr:GntR family transcriptional regulator [Capsulimonadaceae bacterium]
MPIAESKEMTGRVRQSRSQRVAEHLRREIVDGRYAPDALLPGRRALAKAYDVALPTIEQAIKELVEEGLLRAENGRGTFVASHTETVTNADHDASSAGRLLLSRSMPAIRKTAATVGIISSSDSVHEDGTSDRNFWNEVIVHNMERLVGAAGGSTCYANLVGWLGDNADAPLAGRRLIDQGCEAILVVLARGGSVYHKGFPELCAMGVPIVYVGGSASRLPLTQVFFDDRDAGQHAMAHLIDQGAGKLAFFSPFTTYWVDLRLEGALEAIDFRNIDRSSMAVCTGKSKVPQVRDAVQERLAYEYAKEALANGLDADGVLAANDLIAYGFARAAEEAGMKMGRDYMIVGVDDDPTSREIGLSSMRPPLEAMAQEAIRMLTDILAGPRSNRSLCLHCDLIARSSTRTYSPE